MSNPMSGASSHQTSRPRGPAGSEGAVDVVVCGQTVRLGCEPGQEDRIRRLAQAVDERAGALAASGVTSANTPFSRLVLMTALMLADELEEVEKRAEKGEAGEAAPAMQRAPADALDHAFARILIDAAQRLETVAQKIEQE
jgi:cell division protein ZapA (FtsZ GTPase activity inhibitor)